MKPKLSMSKFSRTFFNMLMDAIFILLSYLSIQYMFVVANAGIDWETLLNALPFVVVFQLIVMFVMGIYQMLPNHVGFEDIMRIGLSSIISNVIIVLFIAVTNNVFMYKSAFIFIVPIQIGFFTLPRILNRIRVFFKTNMFMNSHQGKRTLIIGAGAAGELVLREIFRNKDIANYPIAFVDDDPKKIGNKMNGIQVLGPIQNINNYIHMFDIEEIILAIAEYPTAKLNELVSEAAKFKIKIKKLLSYSDLKDNKPKIVDIKVDDLLNREVIKLDNEGIEAFIKDEVVLVTGGGGSIGSELCRQIAEFKPKMLLIFDIYENNAYDIQQELLRKFSKEHRETDLNLVVRIGSVYNKKRMEEIFFEFRPTVVFHAAAYKHVPLMEDSAVEAVRTNVIGTHNVSTLSDKYKVKKFILVSSDKAVRSTNIMGASKRFAELIIQNVGSNSKTQFSAVRFGNVLGSNGSVIPLFKKQIEDGGPVTVTHPEINRFFMTIPEAVSLILQSAVYSKGGEVFILDMGQPVKIKDLAEKLITLSGYKPYKDIDIIFTGLRPGEKLYEELLVDRDNTKQTETANKRIFIEKQKQVSEEELTLIEVFLTFEQKSNNEIKEMISKVIKTYTIKA